MLEIKQHSQGVYSIVSREMQVHLLYFDFGLVLSKQISEERERKLVAEIAKLVEKEMIRSEHDNQ